MIRYLFHHNVASCTSTLLFIDFCSHCKIRCCKHHFCGKGIRCRRACCGFCCSCGHCKVSAVFVAKRLAVVVAVVGSVLAANFNGSVCLLL